MRDGAVAHGGSGSSGGLNPFGGPTGGLVGVGLNAAGNAIAGGCDCLTGLPAGGTPPPVTPLAPLPPGGQPPPLPPPPPPFQVPRPLGDQPLPLAPGGTEPPMQQSLLSYLFSLLPPNPIIPLPTGGSTVYVDPWTPSFADTLTGAGLGDQVAVGLGR